MFKIACLYQEEISPTSYFANLTNLIQIVCQTLKVLKIRFPHSIDSSCHKFKTSALKFLNMLFLAQEFVFEFVIHCLILRLESHLRFFTDAQKSSFSGTFTGLWKAPVLCFPFLTL